MCRTVLSATALCLALCVSWGTPVWADPIVSIDTDPSTSGIQNTLTVNLGDSVTVDVVITNLNLSGPTIERVELDVGFDSSILTATTVALGGFFSGGTVTIIENDVAPPDVNFTATGSGNDATQPFASITFTAIGTGTTALDLNDVVLSDKDGLFSFPQDPSSPVDGEITVTAIPEPSSLLLLGTGLVGLGLCRWWRSGQA